MSGADDRRTRPRETTDDPPFRERTLPLPGGHLFDVGVVDVDGDGWLDIYTSNHASRHALLVNDGTGRFEDVLTRRRLNLEPAFPAWDDAGWVDDIALPDMSAEGLYLYRRQEAIVIRLVTTERGAIVMGRIEFSCAVTVYRRESVAVTVTEREAAPVHAAVVDFTAIGGEACLVLLPFLTSLPITVSVAEGWPVSRVFVGAPTTSPSERRFTLRLRDRHGMAWADYDGDGRTDVFIARGGLKGRLALFGGQVLDELLVNRGTHFDDVTAAAGLRKCGCRSRQAAWVDFDGDGWLDLFVSCAGDGPRLYRQERQGTFANVTADVCADVRGDCFTWIDVDADGCPELLAAQACQLIVYRRGRAGRFVRDQVVRLRNRTSRVTRLAIADIDGDGAPDLFVPAADGNTLLLNDGGIFRAVDPGAVGLPTDGGLTASWVDVDNDGLTDLHVIPGGLFRQVSRGRFIAVTGVERLAPSAVRDARLVWFDATNTGARDALVAYQPASGRTRVDAHWQFALHENRMALGHWLELDLVGSVGNRAAIGAVVTITAGGTTQTQWVGANDGSHYSQGHYRVYFGLHRESEAATLTVRWPDGHLQHLEHVRAGQVLRLHHPATAATRVSSSVPV